MVENRITSSDEVLSIISQLQAPVPDVDTLLTLLSAPLSNIGLLPSKYQRYNTSSLPLGSIDVPRHIPPIQRAIIENISSTWHPELMEMNASDIIEQYFCPDIVFNASPVAGQISSLAYMTVLAQSLNSFSIHVLARLSREYPVDRVFLAACSSQSPVVTWEDCIRNFLAVPTKVANAVGESKDIPDALLQKNYMDGFSTRYEVLVYSLHTSNSQETSTALAFGLSKMANIGLFPSTPPMSTQPSFFQVTLSTLRQRTAADWRCTRLWPQILRSIPSTIATRNVACSLLITIDSSLICELNSNPSPLARAQVKREAQFLRHFCGSLDDDEFKDMLSSLVVGRVWTFGLARVIVSYFAGAGLGTVDERSVTTLIDAAIEIWSSPVHIKYSLLKQHRYLTELLLLSLSHLPVSSDKLQKLALRSSFISCIGTYIGHGDESVRRCGMLVAEVLAQKVGKKLDFGEWEGENPSKIWARDLRQLISARDIDADLSQAESEEPAVLSSTSDSILNAQATQDLGMDAKESATGSDNDSLIGYESSDHSRTPSPSPSELEEIEKDPSLSVKPRPVPKPVYLAQLGTLIRGSGGLRGADENEADRIEMAINVGEELIRRKRLFGSELEENAVDLVHCFVGLNDNYDLKDFQQKRQKILTALVACCPRKSAPTIIEQFFSSQYSTEQRFAMLNALAFGARELANLPLPTEQKPSYQSLFPSRMLPGPLHNRYAAQYEPIHELTGGITRLALDSAKDGSTDKLPVEIVRERRLRIRPTAKIEVLKKDGEQAPQQSMQPNTFFQVAAEFFIGPLISRFWTFLQDEQTRERITANRSVNKRYRSAGTGLILSPLVLSSFIATLTILVHASQNSPEWLGIIGPGALELAVVVGTRPVTRPEDNPEDEESVQEGKQEASVLSSALELGLVVLDACLEIDGGRSLGLSHTSLLLGVEEWATQVFSLLEKGVRVEAEGGVQELKLRRAAAGVLIKTDALKSRWRQSMVDIR